jgi:protein-S-isoprenylcysteine O-methyltransferase Ste14
MGTSHTLLGLVTVLGVIAAYISGVWGIYGHFLVRDKIEPAMKLTSALSLAGLIWFLVERWRHGALTGSVAPALDGVAVVLLAGFMLLFWWTVSATRGRRLTLAFSNDQPEFIYTTGPYALLRHPFYTSYIIFWIAVAFGSGTWLFGVLPLAMCILYWRAIQLEEAKFAASSLSLAYANYKRHTDGVLARFTSRQKSSDHP